MFGIRYAKHDLGIQVYYGMGMMQYDCAIISIKSVVN